MCLAKDFNTDAATKKSVCLLHDIEGWVCNIQGAFLAPSGALIAIPTY